MKENKNKLLMQRNDIQQKRADQLDLATKAIGNGDTTGYNAAMEKVNGYNTDLERINGLMTECEKEFSGADFQQMGEGENRVNKSGVSLMKQIRSTDRYTDAFMKAMVQGVSPDKGVGMAELKPLYEAEAAVKALSISGGDPAGSDGGFLAPVDFDNQVIAIAKEYIDLSALVSVENVSVNSGWRVIDAAGTRTALSKIDELGTISEGQKAKFSKIAFNCSKYGDKLIASSELMADAPALMRYLAEWWAPKVVMTKNALILVLLDKLALQPLADDGQVKALKTLLNTGLNTAASRHATILTNALGYNAMDNWMDQTGRPLLVPDPKGGDFDLFKGRKVTFADVDEIPNVTASGTEYAPLYVGDLKRFCRLFLREGTRVKSTDVGGNAWNTDSWEIRCTTRMDCQQLDGAAAKRAGLKV